MGFENVVDFKNHTTEATSFVRLLIQDEGRVVFTRRRDRYPTTVVAHRHVHCFVPAKLIGVEVDCSIDVADMERYYRYIHEGCLSIALVGKGSSSTRSVPLAAKCQTFVRRIGGLVSGSVAGQLDKRYKTGHSNSTPMHWTTLSAFIALEIVLCLIPGPAVLCVIGATLAGRSRAGFATAAGILTGNTAYFVICGLGVVSVIAASHQAFVVIKWCGAAYLAYLGIRALIARPPGTAQTAPDVSKVTVRGWASGTVVQLSNPKALVFFAAILPQFIDPRTSLLPQIIILGIAGLAVELCVLSAYIAAADRISKHGFDGRRQIMAQRVGGAFLLGVAAAVARST